MKEPGRCDRCGAPEREYRVRGALGIFCLSCRKSWDTPAPDPREYPPPEVEPAAVKVEFMRGQPRYVDVLRIREVSDLRDSGPPRSLTAERCVLSMQQIRVAESTFSFAFDPITGTVYLADAVDGGWMLHQARHEAELGRPLPFQREVERAERDARAAHSQRQAAEREREKTERVAREAVERLKSPKPGIRRRAKRLLERLGR